jgi:hypothetical protein
MTLSDSRQYAASKAIGRCALRRKRKNGWSTAVDQPRYPGSLGRKWCAALHRVAHPFRAGRARHRPPTWIPSFSSREENERGPFRNASTQTTNCPNNDARPTAGCVRHTTQHVFFGCAILFGVSPRFLSS